MRLPLLLLLAACDADPPAPAPPAPAPGIGEGEGEGEGEGLGDGLSACEQPVVDDGMGGGGDRDVSMGGDHVEAGIGRPLDVLIAGLIDAGQVATGEPAPPTVELFPSGISKLSGPIGLRLCVSDPNGVVDLDPQGVTLQFHGGRHDGQLRWAVHGPGRVCGRILSGDPTVGGEILGFREWQGDSVSINARALDLGGGDSGLAVARIDRHELPPVKFREIGQLAGLGDPGKGYGGNTHTLGPAWIDYDGDDYPDVFIANGAGAPNRLFHNQGDGTFTDVTVDTPLALDRFEGAGSLFADVDNDGDEDLYILGAHPVLAVAGVGLQGLADNPVPGHRGHLFINHGDCWRDSAEDAGILDLNEDGAPYRTIAGAFADYDRDGCVDLYLVHWRMGGAQEPEWEQDRLYKGDCLGGFRDVTAAAGLDGYARNGLAVLFADLDTDGWPDLYVVNVNEGRQAQAPSQRDDAKAHWGEARGDDLLFRNKGDGTFEEISEAAGVGRDAFAGMGIDAADYDGDGDYDLYITDVDEPPGFGNALYRNLFAETGELKFEEVSFQLGSQPLSGDFGWGVVWGDFNLDTHPDLFYAGNSSRWLFLGNGEGNFDAVTGPVGFLYGSEVGLPDEISSGKGVASADYDRDGDLDLLVVLDDPRRQAVPPLLIRNDSPSVGLHWLEVKLLATSSNRSAIGAEVRVSLPGSRLLTRQVLGGHSSHSQSERIVHFGLGSAQIADLQIRWPSGVVQDLPGVTADQLLLAEEPSQ